MLQAPACSWRGRAPSRFGRFWVEVHGGLQKPKMQSAESEYSCQTFNVPLQDSDAQRHRTKMQVLVFAVRVCQPPPLLMPGALGCMHHALLHHVDTRST